MSNVVNVFDIIFEFMVWSVIVEDLGVVGDVIICFVLFEGMCYKV